MLHRLFKKSPESQAAAFVRALERSALTVARRLLSGGVDPNLTVEGTTPMSRALVLGDLALVEACLAAGAHVNLRGEDRNSLWLASQSKLDRYRKVRTLLKAKADPNCSLTPSRRTVLTRACLAGDTTFAGWLALGGGDTNRPDFHGVSALRIAQMKGQAELVRLFLECGARPETPSPHDVEQTFLIENSLWSQLHEIVKAAIARNAHTLERLETSWPEARGITLTYRLATGLALRLGIRASGRITLAVRQGDEDEWSDLFSSSRWGHGNLDATELRGRLNLAFRELREPSRREPGARQQQRQRQHGPRLFTADELSAHEVLGLTPGASHHDIRDAYRRLAKLHHPDIASNDEAESMKRINAAYRKLLHKA